MSVSFQEGFWGMSLTGHDVLVNELKSCSNSARELYDVLKARATVEEAYSKSLMKIQKPSSDESGAFSMTQTLFLSRTEETANHHMMLSTDLQEVARQLKEAGIGADGTAPKPPVGFKELHVPELRAILLSSSAAFLRARRHYFRACQEYSTFVLKANSLVGSTKDSEKASKENRKLKQRMDQMCEEYTMAVKKYNFDRTRYVDATEKALVLFEEALRSILSKLQNVTTRVLDREDSLVERIRACFAQWREQITQVTIDKSIEYLTARKGTGTKRPGAQSVEEFEAGTTSVTDPIDVPNDGAVGESGGHLQEAKGGLRHLTLRKHRKGGKGGGGTTSETASPDTSASASPGKSAGSPLRNTSTHSVVHAWKSDVSTGANDGPDAMDAMGAGAPAAVVTGIDEDGFRDAPDLVDEYRNATQAGFSDDSDDSDDEEWKGHQRPKIMVRIGERKPSDASDSIEPTGSAPSTLLSIPSAPTSTNTSAISQPPSTREGARRLRSQLPSSTAPSSANTSVSGATLTATSSATDASATVTADPSLKPESDNPEPLAEDLFAKANLFDVNRGESLNESWATEGEGPLQLGTDMILTEEQQNNLRSSESTDLSVLSSVTHTNSNNASVSGDAVAATPSTSSLDAALAQSTPTLPAPPSRVTVTTGAPATGTSPVVARRLRTHDRRVSELLALEPVAAGVKLSPILIPESADSSVVSTPTGFAPVLRSTSYETATRTGEPGASHTPVTARSSIMSNSSNSSTALSSTGATNSLQLSVAVTETINAYFKGAQLTKTVVSGDVLCNFPANTLTTLEGLSTSAPETALGGVRLTAIGSLSDPQLNKELLTTNGEFDGKLSLSSSAVQSLVKSSAGKAVSASVLKYSVSNVSASNIPLRLCSTVVHQSGNTLVLTIHYQLNKDWSTQEQTDQVHTHAHLSEVSLAAVFSGECGACSAVPETAVWSANASASRNAIWSLGELATTSTTGGRGKLEARIVMANPAEPVKLVNVMAKFRAEDGLLSNVGVETFGECSLKRLLRRSVTGKYLSVTE